MDRRGETRFGEFYRPVKFKENRLSFNDPTLHEIRISFEMKIEMIIIVEKRNRITEKILPLLANFMNGVICGKNSNESFRIV